jgi:hypothetical protein
MDSPAKIQSAPGLLAGGIAILSLPTTDTLGVNISEWVLQAKSRGEWVGWSLCILHEQRTSRLRPSRLTPVER